MHVTATVWQQTHSRLWAFPPDKDGALCSSMDRIGPVGAAAGLVGVLGAVLGAVHLAQHAACASCSRAVPVFASLRQTFTRFVQIGRVAMINYGPDEGRLCTIIDVVDQNRALVDGPYGLTGVHRQVINFRRLALTDYTVKIGLNARAKSLKKAWAKEGVMEKWQKSAWAGKRARRSARSQMSDFDRFKAMLEGKAVRASDGCAVAAVA